MLSFWVGATLGSILIFAWPELGVLMWLGVTIPFIIALFALPTLWLYLTVAAVPYVMLRHWSERGAALISLGLALGLGVLVPVLNRSRLPQAVQNVTATDIGGPIKVNGSQTIAYLSTYASSDACDEHCQRLLFSGAAGAVLVSRTPAGDRPDGTTEVARFWIGPRRGQCQTPRITTAFATDADVSGQNRPLIAMKLGDLYAEDKCFFEDRTTLASADVILVQSFYRNGHQRVFDGRLLPVDLEQRIATFRREDGGFRKVMQRSYGTMRYLMIPLIAIPAISVDTYKGGGWLTNSTREIGRRPTAELSDFLLNDLKVHGLEGDPDLP